MRAALVPGLLATFPLMGVAQGPYAFDGPIPREVLDRYLSRSVTIMSLMGREGRRDQWRFMLATGTKFAGRAYTAWGGEGYHAPRIDESRALAETIHTLDPEIILQGTIFEIITTSVNAVAVPAWALEAFGLPVEERNFRYDDMLYPDGQLVDHWSGGASVPDITQPETQLWFYTLGRKYVDAGYEAIHVGQVELIGRTDEGWEHWWDVLTRIRDYAREYGRRHIMLLDGHVPSSGLVHGEEELLFDFHSCPMRMKEVEGQPMRTVLEMGHLDTIYGRSKGGLTPSGWRCENLPYLVEVDNYGTTDREGESYGDWFPWGYDEMGWFCHQPKEYRDEWLGYAWQWVRDNDPNGWVQMPAARVIHSPVGDTKWYYANRPSDEIPDGFDHEDTIRRCWGHEAWDLTRELADGPVTWTAPAAMSVAVAGMSGGEALRVSGAAAVDLPAGDDTPFRMVVDVEAGESLTVVAGASAFVVVSRR